MGHDQQAGLERALAVFAAATKNHLYDPSRKKWAVTATETSETIENYLESSKGYYYCAKPTFGSIAGFPYVAFKQIQPWRTYRRHPLSVIDFGIKRYAVFADLEEYAADRQELRQDFQKPEAE